ncbi:nucleoside triphosphate pyrophosphohydrolase [Terricaulis sp.]|uniref:nucleoside triphosphate pyrophosphohydrolase n=1 Tax=Terricaulis sp. TaxID=2768686 RepID=UPI002AC62B0B|nr:nucleoside triphosphate pyrophosphohydrolase [Terricaulis sp.]MDZ4692670.1 nucleoside triphosphate pyrophosphohydrolase [Terricaulis sp.]
MPSQATDKETEKSAEALSRNAAATQAVLNVMARLRDPQRGCPWDIEQSFATIAPYTIEEAYEVADAIERQDMPALKEELGDLLFQVAFHARMAEEVGAFDFADVAQALADKMIERHPHVFSEVGDGRTAHQQTVAWETLKAEKRAAKGAASLLDDVAMALPALQRAEKLTKRAARINFDWPAPEPVLAKLEEELAELKEARASGDQEHIAEEMGDILFVMANLARKLNVDPEEALRRANAKFTRRFQFIETKLAEQGRTGPQPLDDMEALWLEAKRAERK